MNKPTVQCIEWHLQRGDGKKRDQTSGIGGYHGDHEEPEASYHYSAR